MNAAALSTAVAKPSHAPQMTDTTSTASRYTTPSDTTGAICFSGYRISVHSATAPTATIAPVRRDGSSALSRNPNGLDTFVSVMA